MAKKKNGKKDKEEIELETEPRESYLSQETKKSIWGIAFLGLALILILAGLEKAGPVGEWLYFVFETLLGWGYYILPLSLLLVSGLFLLSRTQRIIGITFFGLLLLILASLGLIHIFSPGNGGWIGLILGSLVIPFGQTAATIINVAVTIGSFLVILNTPLRLPRFRKEEVSAESVEPVITMPEGMEADEEKEEVEEKPKLQPKKEEGEEDEEKEEIEPDIIEKGFAPRLKKAVEMKFVNYVAPPLDLLKASTERPTTGDLRGNANIIKRTLESFGIPVEMGEINIGPKVTRYTLKPAEGVKLSRIIALNQDLALALAAHPIRIEAPIPGKSLVGIEVPNKAAALVRLGSMMAYPEFQNSGPLGFALGRDVTGEPVFAKVDKMPHLLIAGATGSGKSVTVHSLIVSLLYKNSPADLRLVMIDPKRVELSAYENIPHLVNPVITDNKKAAAVFRWALNEMDRRYDILQQAGSRDIKSYNANAGKENPMPNIVIIVDELADLMSTYGREVEGSIVRLTQMARATGIHLVLATQRPSVEVITGLIKANVPARIALQVASQIDSRTILDTAGAEKLLGGGDLLLLSAELAKPKRVQAAFISEEEINKVADFIREHNEPVPVPSSETEGEEGGEKAPTGVSPMNPNLEDFSGGESGEDDELLLEAVRVVNDSKKASTSFLQRRLKLGYARAARVLDLMEERDLVGPGSGAKPREIYEEKIAEFLELH